MFEFFGKIFFTHIEFALHEDWPIPERMLTPKRFPEMYSMEKAFKKNGLYG